ncbi:hypothetical protein GUJ93_ZPchr0005g14918 [Zizania palustris]|uniref:tRNA pseudouridine synthase n=2 Tax=Zizania palustris TaxID=103762 RepID=A0A8J5VDD0_ZIZPA|nr:hypothetical protein GUJ93_ZPchr0005g14918 [Zizania palustris]
MRTAWLSGGRSPPVKSWTRCASSRRPARGRRAWNLLPYSSTVPVRLHSASSNSGADRRGGGKPQVQQLLELPPRRRALVLLELDVPKLCDVLQVERGHPNALLCHCWQYQPSPPTIQCCIENALTHITKLDRKELCLVGSGRTDTGVHAWGQVAHFTTPFAYNCLDSIHTAINGLLPCEIRVREISAAHPEFHARTSTRSKIYHYKIYNGTVMDPFHNLYAYHIHNDRVRSPIKKIMRFDVVEMGAILQLEVEGTGFLYRQVRNMVALLLQVGREALPPNIVPEIIAARDRMELAKVALSAPPHGLYLMSVNYDQEMLKPPDGSPPISFGRARQESVCSPKA